MGELADLNQRTRSTATQIDFSSTDRKTKRLIELQDVTCNMGDRALFEGLNFILTAGMRVGLVGRTAAARPLCFVCYRATLLRLEARFAALIGCASFTSTRLARSIPM